jgi:hypothetical protein
VNCFVDSFHGNQASAWCMDADLSVAKVRGGVEVPATPFADAAWRLVVTGKFVRIAGVHDEIWLEGEIQNPSALAAKLKGDGFAADIFSFGQKIPDTTPKYPYHFEWDNFAVISLTTYAAWWDKLPQESRRNVRVAGKRGVVTKAVEFSDDLVRGISAIYNDSPTRRGGAFPHYGKSLENVKRENGTYVERSQFIGAFVGDELIGFTKMVYVDGLASLMQFISKRGHLDKRPMNALLAKAVELCTQRGSRHLVYRKFTYGNVFSQLTEFKRRNGFEEMKYPRYYIPLTLKGRLALKFRLHLGWRDSLPPWLITRLTRNNALRSLAGWARTSNTAIGVM